MGWYVVDGIVFTNVDIVTFEFLEAVTGFNDLTNYPTLQAFKVAIAAKPRIAAYIASADRPKPPPQSA